MSIHGAMSQWSWPKLLDFAGVWKEPFRLHMKQGNSFPVRDSGSLMKSFTTQLLIRSANPFILGQFKILSVWTCQLNLQLLELCWISSSWSRIQSTFLKIRCAQNLRVGEREQWFRRFKCSIDYWLWAQQYFSLTLGLMDLANYCLCESY